MKFPWPSVHGVSLTLWPQTLGYALASYIGHVVWRMKGWFAYASSKLANGSLSEIGILTIPIHTCKSPALKFSLLL